MLREGPGPRRPNLPPPTPDEQYSLTTLTQVHHQKKRPTHMQQNCSWVYFTLFFVSGQTINLLECSVDRKKERVWEREMESRKEEVLIWIKCYMLNHNNTRSSCLGFDCTWADTDTGFMTNDSTNPLHLIFPVPLPFSLQVPLSITPTIIM